VLSTPIGSADLWDEGLPEYKRTLQTARLFPILNAAAAAGDDFGEVVGVDPAVGTVLLRLLSKSKKGPVSAVELKQWRESPRVSIAQVTGMADVEDEFHWQHQLEYYMMAQV
jgi:hypothetical protein